jgi:hypothetical protein
MEDEILRLKKRINDLRKLLIQSDIAGINFENSDYGGYLWRAIMDVVHNEKNEEV